MIFKFDNDELRADALEAKTHTKMTLSQLVGMGEEMQNLQDRMERKAEELKALKEEHDRIAEVQLPEAMQMMGLKFFGLNDGYEINIQPVVSTKIKPEHQEAAYQWLREHGHDDIIKNEVVVTFGKNEEQYAKDLMSNIVEMTKHDWKCGGVARDWTIHPQTLKAFVTTQLEAGTEFPTELFGLYVGKIAKLVKPKKRK